MIINFEAAWKRRDYRQGIDILERARRLAPAEARVLFYLGRCHGMRYDYAAAERYFENAIRAEGWKSVSFLKAGRYGRSFGRLEMAQGFFERGLKRDGNSIEILVELARIYMRQGRRDEAGSLVDRALQLNGDFAPALLVCARLHRVAGQLEEAEKVLRSFVTKPEANGWMQAESWYELGATLDRQGRYDEAMEAFLAAKAVKPPLAATQPARDWQVFEAETKQMTEGLDADILRRWRDANAASSVQRMALLCGHPRSGTTLLEQVLDAHPDIVSAEETLIFNDEAFVPFFRGQVPAAISFAFARVLDSASPDRLRQSRQDYLHCTERFLGEAIRGRLLIDKNPGLTTYIPAFIRIFPETKFLIALRDPRDVCLSCFMQPLFSAGPTGALYPSLAATTRQYALEMGFWLDIKPRMPSPWLEVRYEELVKDLEAVARRTLEFLEVPWEEQVLQFQQRERDKLVRSPTYADVKKPVSRGAIGRWRNYQKYLEPYLPALEPFIKAFGYE